jgi:hypothetical protein
MRDPFGHFSQVFLDRCSLSIMTQGLRNLRRQRLLTDQQYHLKFFPDVAFAMYQYGPPRRGGRFMPSDPVGTGRSKPPPQFLAARFVKYEKAVRWRIGVFPSHV